MLGSVGVPVALGAVLLGLTYYGILFYCVWKFYQILSRINDNIAAIHVSMAGSVRSAASPAPPRPTRIQQCPGCGLKVVPTVEGLCPSCHVAMEQ